MMVGLSVVLEGHHHHLQKTGHVSKKTIGGSSSHPQVISKTSMSSIMAPPIHSTKPPPPRSPGSSSCSGFPASAFLERCFLCRVKLLPEKDIYMYKGDRAFCSVECRYRQIFMDEEETLRKDKCSMAAIKPVAAASPSFQPTPASSRHRKAARSHRAGGIAY